MSIDYELLSKFGILDVVPHIMILPSAFKHFIKVRKFVDSVVCLYREKHGNYR